MFFRADTRRVALSYEGFTTLSPSLSLSSLSLYRGLLCQHFPLPIPFLLFYPRHLQLQLLPNVVPWSFSNDVVRSLILDFTFQYNCITVSSYMDTLRCLCVRNIHDYFFLSLRITWSFVKRLRFSIFPVFYHTFLLFLCSFYCSREVFKIFFFSGNLTSEISFLKIPCVSNICSLEISIRLLTTFIFSFYFQNNWIFVLAIHYYM